MRSFDANVMSGPDKERRHEPIIGSLHGLCCSRCNTELGAHRDEIEQLQSAARRVATNPDEGPTARQSVGAQLGHQPTPASVKQAEKQAQSRFAAILARARVLDAQGRHTQCMRAVADARRTLDMN